MDPNKAMDDMMRLRETDPSEAHAIAWELREWLEKGGFVPTGQTRQSALAWCRRIIRSAPKSAD